MILGCLVGMLLGVGMWACQPGSDDDALRGRSGVLLENLSEWICVDSVTPEGYALLCGCQIYGDTMLAGERWKKVYEEGAGMSFLRQEGERVYRYDVRTGEGLLVFDFDVQAGDRVTVHGLDGAETLTVEEVGDTILPGGNGMPYRYVSLSAGDYHDVWVEDMGSLRTGFYFRGASTKFEGAFFKKLPGLFLYMNPEYAHMINESQSGR